MTELDEFDQRMKQLPGVLGCAHPGGHVLDNAAFLVFIDETVDFNAPAYPTTHNGKKVIYYPIPRPVAE